MLYDLNTSREKMEEIVLERFRDIPSEKKAGHALLAASDVSSVRYSSGRGFRGENNRHTDRLDLVYIHTGAESTYRALPFRVQVEVEDADVVVVTPIVLVLKEVTTMGIGAADPLRRAST